MSVRKNLEEATYIQQLPMDPPRVDSSVDPQNRRVEQNDGRIPPVPRAPQGPQAQNLIYIAEDRNRAIRAYAVPVFKLFIQEYLNHLLKQHSSS